ncbi:MAG: SGNH/GDSL hydrolase family protein [Coriobacteriia bacterium]
MLYVTGIGDSITENIVAEQSYLYLLMQRLGEASIALAEFSPPTSPVFIYNQMAGSAYTFWNAAVSGNTTAMMLARFDTDVAIHANGWVIVQAGVNDAAGGATAAAIESNITMLSSKIVGSGAAPVLTTITPYESGSAGQKAVIDAVNAWLVTFCAAANIPLVDFYGAVDDGTQGWAAGLSDDGTHPTTAGHAALANAFPLATFAARESGPFLVLKTA